MNILFFIPALLLLLYCLYKQVKDDYFFIRKNVSTEQIFDIAFISIWVALFFSRVVAMILNPVSDQNIFLSFFSFRTSDFSVTGLVLGAIVGLYSIGKYKKIPLERLFDIFTISFSIALPVGMLIYMLSFKEYLLLLYFVNSLVYGLFAYVLIKYLNPKYIVFSIFFFLISLTNSLVIQFLNKSSYLSGENILILILFILSVVLLIKQKITKSVFVKKYKA